MLIIDCIQGSEEWHQARLGIPTASNFDKIVTSKGEPSKQAEKYLYQLAAERITGKKEDSFKSEAMQRGNDLEAEAIKFYELTREQTVQKVGFCLDDSKNLGCSPDGFVGNKGLVEIKCPLSHTHITYLLSGGLDSDYFHQVQGNLLVTGREWCDLISYYPAIKPIVIRIERNKEFLAKLKTELEKFCDKLTKITEELK